MVEVGNRGVTLIDMCLYAQCLCFAMMAQWLEVQVRFVTFSEFEALRGPTIGRKQN